MRKTVTTLGTLAALLLAGPALAQMTPVGTWKTIDDKTNTERSLVRITESGGVITGTVERLLAADAKPDAVCDKCTDDRKDKPMVGLQVVRDVRRKGSDNLWEGGTILDAREGKVYRVRMVPIEDGRKMEVRGFIGTPMLGRTQVWIRVE
jgi:uncharacterized protein (DUF2147 family)